MAGFTLVELLVTVAILSVLTSLAIPRMKVFFDNRRLQTASTTLYNDLRYAQAQALRRNQTVYYTLTSGSNWCYGLSVTAGCNCNTANSCELRAQSASSFAGVVMQTPTAATGSFVPTSGLATASTIGFTSASGKVVNVILGLAGSLSLCSPAGSTSSMEYPPC